MPSPAPKVGLQPDGDRLKPVLRRERQEEEIANA